MATQYNLNKTFQAGSKFLLNFLSSQRGLDALDGDRFALLLAGMMAGGAALYLALPFEPSLISVICLLCLTLLMIVWLFLCGRYWRLSWCVVALCAGFIIGFGHIYARYNLISVVQPIKQAQFYGRIESVTPMADGQRLILRGVHIDEKGRQMDLPGVSLRWKPGRTAAHDPDMQNSFQAGDIIAGRAMLWPIAGPNYPGGYDFRLGNYIDGIVANGLLIGMPDLRDEQISLPLTRVSVWRQQIDTYLRQKIPGAAGTVASALLTGYQSAIPEQVHEHIRISGLAHLMSISGLHMSLVAGFFFVVMRRLIVFGHLLMPRYVSAVAGRKIAAIIAIIAGCGYLLLSGASVPAQRSCITLVLVMLAIIFDRDVVNFRMLALAMALIIFLSPVQARAPGAILSFLSVMALVGFYNNFRGCMVRDWLEQRGWPGIIIKVCAFPAGLALTSLIAGLVTWPIVLAFFGRASNYAVLSNMIAVPLASFWVMPVGVIGLMLMPVGLDHIFWPLMGWGIEQILAVSQWVSTLPGTALTAGNISDVFLAAIIIAIFLVILGPAMWGWAATALIIAIAGIVVTPAPPDMLVDHVHNRFALRQGSKMIISSQKTNTNQINDWAHFMSADQTMTKHQAAAQNMITCDSIGCVMHSDFGIISMPDQTATVDDCRAARWIIDFSNQSPCAGQNIIQQIRQDPDWQGAGATAIWFDDKSRPRFQHTSNGRRPWQNETDYNPGLRGE